jgi:hypothetical protein
MKNLKDMSARIDKEIEQIIKRDISLKRDDLPQLSKELVGIHNIVDRLGNFIKDQIREQKIVTAKKAIECLLSNGFSFQDVKLDGVSFEINGKEIIQQRYDFSFPDEEPDTPF